MREYALVSLIYIQQVKNMSKSSPCPPQMLRSVRFSIALSTAAVEREPDLTQRLIMFEIYDGEYWSEPAFATVTIEPVNDNKPHIQLTALGEVRKSLQELLQSSRNLLFPCSHL